MADRLTKSLLNVVVTHITCAYLFWTGIWLHDSGVLAASLDSIVVHAPAHDAEFAAVSTPYLLEIKCPYAHRHSTVLDAAENEEFFFGDYNIKLYLLTKNTSILDD